jgi:hypothetical protein
VEHWLALVKPSSRVGTGFDLYCEAAYKLFAPLARGLASAHTNRLTLGAAGHRLTDYPEEARASSGSSKRDRMDWEVTQSSKSGPKYQEFGTDEQDRISRLRLT